MPSKYIEFINRDENIDFDVKMALLQKEFTELLQAEQQSKNDLLTVFKQFIKSVANLVGTDMENYKIIRKNQFACSTMQVRRDKKMPVALLQEVEEAIISQAYPIFEIVDTVPFT